MNEFENLKLENQLCFPLYAAAKEVVRLYTPLLEQLDLTYTQYIVMMIVWEKKEVVVKELAERLFLDTGTLTPLLRKLEKKGLITLAKAETDKRSVMICVTEEGLNLRKQAVHVPEQVAGCIPLEKEEAGQLYHILYKILSKE